MCAIQVLTLWPSVCKTDALPTELIAHIGFSARVRSQTNRTKICCATNYTTEKLVAGTSDALASFSL